MNNTIPTANWLDHIDDEYLATFIKDGGAAVKFAVTDTDGRQALVEDLRARCRERQHLFMCLDAIKSRVHMPQDIFSEMASQIDWRLLARRVVLRLLSKKTFNVEGIDPNGPDNIIDAVALNNGIEPQSVLLELRPVLERSVLKNANMVRDFRVAMTHLCHFEREKAAPEAYAGQPLLDWLTGANTRIGNVRPFPGPHAHQSHNGPLLH